jgi:hypothetical protein
MTDSTSMALVRYLAPLQPGPRALRAAVLAQVVFTSPEAFDALCEATERESPVAVRALIEKHLKAVSEKEGRPVARKTTISPGLQTGCLGRLAGAGDTAVDMITNLVSALKAGAAKAWSRIEAGEAATLVLSDRKGLNLPPFRSHCVARFLWLHSRGRYGESPESLEVGQGAVDALLRLRPDGDFAALLDELRDRVARAARTTGRSPDLLKTLDRFGLWPYSAQTHEHLLCEAGKVFGEGRRGRRRRPRPGYRKAFASAVAFYGGHAGRDKRRG